jgi:PBS lyase HEAT-like repeat.
MKESGWEGFAKSLKRLSAAGRQKLLKLKFRWRGFISRLKEAMIDGWTMFGLLFLLFALSEKLPPFCTLFLLVFLLGLALLSVVLHYRFRQISSHALSLKPSESFRWEKVFNRMLSEGEKAIPNLLQILQARQKILLSLLNSNPESLLAIFVLGRLKAQNAVEHLVEFLKAKQVQIDERVAAIWALGEIGDQKAIPALIPFLGDLSEVLFGFYEAKMAFMKGIGLAKEEFRERLRWKVRDWAEEALMKPKPEIVELFRKVVEERDKNALFELAKEYRSEIVAALTGLLDRRQRDWVFNAVWALRELKAVEALPKLRRLARWAGPHLREYCQKVIAELEEFSRLPRAVGVGEIELANLPAIPDPNAIPTENLPRAATPEEKPNRAAMP